MKFRVFCDGKMWYAKDFNKVSHQFMMAMDGSVWALRNIAYDLVEAHRMDATAMRWTGLKDRCGTDIYAGDILEFDIKENGGDLHSGVVEYDPDEGEWHTGLGTNSECSQWKTVIGNVHEDPALVE